MSISGQSLGLIETIGLATAIEAADAAIKSANVELLGYEAAKGNGMHTVKLVGDVGAVKAAVDAGVAAASRIGEVYAYKVLARTAEGLESVIFSDENVGAKAQDAAQEPIKQGEEVKEEPTLESKDVKTPLAETTSKAKAEDKEVVTTTPPKAETTTTKKATKPTTPPANKVTSVRNKPNSRTSRRTASN